MLLVFFPVLLSTAEILIGAFSLYILIMLSSIGELIYDHTFEINYFQTSTSSNLLIFLFLFETIWILSFLASFFEMVLAGVYATWYWTRDKINLVKSETFYQSLHRTKRWATSLCLNFEINSKLIFFSYHLGTVALGSLFITIIKIFRLILKALRSSFSKNSRLGPFIYCCLERLSRHLQEIVEMINRNAYIMTAVHGSDFMTSAKSALYLIKRNLLGILLLDFVSSDFNWIVIHI